MMRLTLSLIFLSILSALAETAPVDKIYQIPDLGQTVKQVYSIKDLAVLKEQKAYEEFFLHAKDIVPAKRDEKWNEMVSNMAQGLAKEIRNRRLVSKSAYELVEGLYTWPSLRDNEFFTRDRNEVALNYLQSCFKTNKEGLGCLKTTVKFWRNSTPKPELGFKVGSLIYNYLEASNKGPLKISESIEHKQILDNGLLEFYSPALTHGLSEFYCKEKQIKKLLWNELISFADKNAADEKKMAHFIDKLMHPDCWKQLQSDYQQRLTSRDQILRDFSYLFLKSKHAITQQDKDAYLFIYLMDIPSPGKTFNEAWNNLAILGKNHERRMALLERLKKLDPLPDALFATFNEKLKEVTTTHISESFPEFLDFYANTCNQYIKGEGNFPNGNPTLNCRSFYNLNSSHQFVAKFLQDQFIQATSL